MISLALLAASSGCATRAEFVHPEFSRFDVQRIGVFDVENTTVYDLKAVTFGGPLQRLTFGVVKYDIPLLLKGAIEEALLRKNYETVNLGPVPSAGAAESGAPSLGPVYNAELTCRIVYWRAVTGSLPEMEVRFRIEIHDTQGELLYAGTFKAAMKETGRTRNPPRPQDVIRPAVLRAFGDLPTGTAGVETAAPAGERPSSDEAPTDED